MQPGLRSWRFVGRVRFLTILGAGVRFFCPIPEVQLDQFLHHTLNLGIPVEMIQILMKLLLKHISCCAPQFPLILTAKFHSLHVKESESGVFLPPTLQPCIQHAYQQC